MTSCCADFSLAVAVVTVTVGLACFYMGFILGSLQGPGGFNGPNTPEQEDDSDGSGCSDDSDCSEEDPRKSPAKRWDSPRGNDSSPDSGVAKRSRGASLASAIRKGLSRT